MAKFIVVCEEYERHGPGQISLTLHDAPDLETVVLALEDIDPADEEGDYDAVEWLKQSNGDGMNFYIIKELLPDGTLSDDLL